MKLKMSREGKYRIAIGIIAIINIALIIYIITLNARISGDVQEKTAKATSVNLDGTNSYITESDHNKEIATAITQGEGNIRGDAVTAATFATVTGADNSGISANQTLSTTSSNTITLGIGDSITLPSGYYAQPTTVQNGVINRGSFNFAPTTSTSSTGEAGYYSSVKANSANAYTTGYNAGKSAGSIHRVVLSGNSATGISNYQSLTSDNFVFVTSKVSLSASFSVGSGNNNSVRADGLFGGTSASCSAISYNSSTGIVSGGKATATSTASGSSTYGSSSGSASISGYYVCFYTE